MILQKSLRARRKLGSLGCMCRNSTGDDCALNDGKWIAYWVGWRNQSPVQVGATKAYLVPSTGGTPQEILPGFVAASYPVWSPDGRTILLLARRVRANGPGDNTADRWAVSAQGGPPVRTGARSVIGPSGPFLAGVPGVWIRDEVLFCDRNPGLAAIQISPGTLHAGTKFRRLSSGTEENLYPSVAPGNSESRLVFASRSTNTDIWALPLESDNARITGSLQRLTTSPATDIYPAMTRDGNRLIYRSDRAGTHDIWLRNLASNVEVRLTATARSKYGLKISAAGSSVVYTDGGKTENLYILPVDPQGVPGIEKVVADKLGGIWDISSDGSKILIGMPGFELLDLNSRKRSGWLRPPGRTVLEARFSPDDHWVTFFEMTGPNHSRIWIVPFRHDLSLASSEWIAVTGGGTFDVVPAWSPGGNMLYFLSDRDGNRCLWAQRLNPETKRPAGDAFGVYHFHQARFSLSTLQLDQTGLAVARDRIVLAIGELTGNIWMGEFR
jgi:eukaryotic-like serine/threonine-protein kinase